MKAVIKLQGQQFIIAQNDRLVVDRLNSAKGEIIKVDQVLAIIDGESQIGTPRLTNATIEAEVLDHIRGDKIRVLRYKSRINYHIASGHRPEQTVLRIAKINC